RKRVICGIKFGVQEGNRKKKAVSEACTTRHVYDCIPATLSPFFCPTIKWKTIVEEVNGESANHAHATKLNPHDSTQRIVAEMQEADCAPRGGNIWVGRVQLQ